MGWSIGYDVRWQRDIGYGVPAVCDHPACNEKIDRGLAYVCGGEPFGGDIFCGLYFCEKHRHRMRQGRPCCSRCADNRAPYDSKPDTPEWIEHKRTDPSWSQWRRDNPEGHV